MHKTLAQLNIVFEKQILCKGNEVITYPFKDYVFINITKARIFKNLKTIHMKTGTSSVFRGLITRNQS